jgi:nucleotide-binding universal stress UspA family protein
MKKVLIALDYKDSAKKVAQAGYQLALESKAQVALLHVVSDASLYSTTSYSDAMILEGFNMPQAVQLAEEFNKEAELFLNTISSHLGNDTIEKLVVTGEFAPSIIDTAKEWGADVIVMGSHHLR